MKRTVPWALAGAFLAWGFAAPPTERHALIVLASPDGYLSPCGCVKPMLGGIGRMAQAVDSLRGTAKPTIIQVGPLSSAGNRQAEIKAETAAESFAMLEGSALSLAAADARLGTGTLESVSRLSKGRLLASDLNGMGLRDLIYHGPFVIGSHDPAWQSSAMLVAAQPAGLAINRLLAEAKATDRIPLLLLQGDLSAARQVAKDHPDLRLIAYRQAGNPAQEIEWQDSTALVSAGDRGRHVARLVWDGKKFSDLSIIALGPAVGEKDQAEALYRRYQERVAAERLLDRVPRKDTEDYIGSKACMPCHAKAAEAWECSAHATALATLEEDHADQDPECVGCHVVGLESTKGFVSRAATPELTDVGCESCHGPGAEHAKAPTLKKMGPAGEESCVGCHNPDHSPGFSFEEYWPKIAH